MSSFYAKDGQFWLDGQPLFIQSGEFHYYRTPKEEWGHRLGLLKNAGFNTVASYMPWLWHQFDEATSDFDGHSHPMRDLAGFIDLAAGMDMYVIARPGPYIMAETINEGIPPWVFTKYPGVAFVSQDGKTQNVVSYQHPDFLACVREWYQAIFQVLAPRQVTRGGKIIMVQLDNEMGMIQWVRNIFDTNPHTIGCFAQYLEKIYGDQLPAIYQVKDLPAFLLQAIKSPQAPDGVQVAENYRRFYRTYLREYAQFLVSEAQSNGLEVPPVINIHGFMNGGKTFPIGISQLIEAMRLDGVISATDVYPGHIGEGDFHQLLMLNEITKSLDNPDQPLASLEFQAGGANDFSNGQVSLFDLHTRLCLSIGMRAVNHYLFTDGENDPVLSPVKRHDWGHPVRKDGSLRRHYHRYPKLSSVLAAYGEALVLAQPVIDTTVGFLLDQFLNEIYIPLEKQAVQVITHQREVIQYDFIARGLALTHRTFDALDLDHASLNPNKTPLLWVMMDKQCDANTQQKLADYVKDGGKLVLVGRICDQEFNHAPCTILKDAIGITNVESDPPFTRSFIHTFGYEDVPVSFLERYTGDFDEVFAKDLSGNPVGFVKEFGEGQLMMLGAALGAWNLGDLDILNQMALKMGLPSSFTLTDWADVRLSRGEQGSFLYINSYLDDPITTQIEYKGSPLFDGNPVSLPARRGAILPLDWHITPDITLHYCTTEITGIREEESALVITTDQDNFFAELSLRGCRCPDATIIEEDGELRRVQLAGSKGLIMLNR